MCPVVDFENVWTVGLEWSPVAPALAGLRANEARYFKNKCEPTAQLLFIGSGRAPCAPPPSMRARPQRRAGKEIAPMTAHDLFVARGGEHSSRRRRAISIATSPAEPSTTGAASPASTHSSACADERQRRPCASPSSRVSPARSRTAIEKARPCTLFPSAAPRCWLRTFGE